MSTELKQAQDEARANAIAIYAGRKPQFGDLMRNPWASEDNPTRDGYFVRARVVRGRFNPGTWYEMTDRNGKFWEVSAEYQFFIDPSAAVPDALPPLPEPDRYDLGGNYGYDVACFTGDQMEQYDRAAVEAELTSQEAHRAQQGEPMANSPEFGGIRAVFEFEEDGLGGQDAAKIKRIDRHDDGGITVVIDHWPEGTRELYAGPVATTKAAAPADAPTRDIRDSKGELVAIARPSCKPQGATPAPDTGIPAAGEVEGGEHA